jgi:hypothetical protein
MPKKLLVPLLSALLLVSGLAAAPAHASKTQESIFQDDRLLIFSGDATRQSALDQMKALGATTVHSLVFWNSIAPQPNSKTKPAGFNASEPNAYPAGAWDQYDALVREASARGMSVVFSPVEAPAWAGRCGALLIRNHCRPDAKEYGEFVKALGTRYSGTFNGLPRVARWSFWNEPNQAGWLQPQEARVHGKTVPVAPALYRALVRAGTASLKAAGHGSDQILLGETAPLGHTSGPLAKRSLAPAPFLQSLFCLDSRGKTLKGSAAAAQDCSGHYTKLAVTGYSHHPYNRGGGQPPLSRPGSGEITIANVSRLTQVLTQGSHARRIRSSLPIYFTEFGFQTNPPDRTIGVPLSRQAQYINQSDYIAYRNSRVKSVAQYQLLDEADLSSFQTGLGFVNGAPKPSLDAYRLPIWVIKHGSRVTVWGQVRPADGTVQQVRIQNGSGSTFNDVKTVTTSADGYFLVNVSHQPKSKWRLSWTAPGGTVFTSRVAGASSR